MLKYFEHNVNPKKRKTGDCSTRALVGCLGISYDEALKLQMKYSLKHYYDPTSKQTMEKVLNEFGFVKMKQPRKSDNTKYTVGEMDQLLTKKQMNEGVLITVANHHTCITNGVVQDIWDCRNKSVGNYYIKVGNTKIYKMSGKTIDNLGKKIKVEIFISANNMDEAFEKARKIYGQEINTGQLVK